MNKIKCISFFKKNFEILLIQHLCQSLYIVKFLFRWTQNPKQKKVERSIFLTLTGRSLKCTLEHAKELLHIQGLRKTVNQHQRQCWKYKLWLTLLTAGWCSRTLNLTVFASGLHCPMVTTSPSWTFTKQGEQCTETFLCLFSKRRYLLTYCK